MKLTKQELQTLIQCVAQTSVPVAQSQKLVELINKMSKMADELDKPEGKEKTK